MEELALLAVAGVLIVVAVSFVAPKLGVAAPVLLVIVGSACSFIPGAPPLEIEPEWILMIVLPPILYAAAVNMPATDFRRDFGAIGALSVFLVVASAFGTGALIWWLFPSLDFASAVAVGAVISPPDAVAATSIGKRLGLPARLVTILEGEGLVNDATALVMLRTAIAAVGGTVSFWGAIGDFAYAVAIGVLVGGLIGAVSVWVRSKVDQPVLTTAISFVVPFIAFIPAEELGASGVLSVVVAGLLTGSLGVRRFSAQSRITERTNWRTAQLLLEHGVFLLMGYQLAGIIEAVEATHLSVWGAIGIGLLATAALLVIRLAFVVPLIAVLRRGQRRAAARVETLDRLISHVEEHRPDAADLSPRRAERYDRVTQQARRRHADASFLAKEGLGWRGGAVIAWSGMRGVVTLAAAQSLPTTVPYRPQLILIALTVAIVTLLVNGGTLPLLIRWLGIRGTDAEATRRETARLFGEIGAAARAALEHPQLRRSDGSEFDPQVVAGVRHNSLAALESVEHEEAWVSGVTPMQQRRELLRIILDAEQAALLDARAGGTYRSSAIEAAQHFIDNEITRLGAIGEG